MWLEIYFKYFEPLIAPCGSFLLPGSGQVLNSQNFKAAIHFITWVILVAVIFFRFPEYNYYWSVFNLYSAIDAWYYDMTDSDELKDPDKIKKGYEEWVRHKEEIEKNPVTVTNPEEVRFKRKVSGNPKNKPLDPID